MFGAGTEVVIDASQLSVSFGDACVFEFVRVSVTTHRGYKFNAIQHRHTHTHEQVTAEKKSIPQITYPVDTFFRAI